MSQEYNDLEDIKQAFLSGDVDLTDEITVDGILFMLRHSTDYKLKDMINDSIKGVVIYTSGRFMHDAREKGLDEWLLLIWGFKPNMTMLPYDVRVTTAARGGALTIHEDREMIGDTVDVDFVRFENQRTLVGKIDTGATISSLHAENIKVEGDSVRFTNKELSPGNVIRMPIKGMQGVSSADGGEEQRPIVAITIQINGQLIEQADFNLNDRSQMDNQVLIGQNILEQGEFLIDPSSDKEESEDFSFEAIQELVNDVEGPSLEDRILSIVHEYANSL